MAISQVRAEIIAHGLDPSIGIAHSNVRDNPVPLVYDLVEPLRPLVDRKILEFALTHVFEPQDFVINRFGACRINPQMAKRLVEGIAFEENQVRSLVKGFLSKLLHKSILLSMFGLIHLLQLHQSGGKCVVLCLEWLRSSHYVLASRRSI